MYEKYLRIPFKNKGRDFKGVDCFGMVSLILSEEYGIKLDRYDISCIDTSKINLQIEVEKKRAIWKKIDKPENPCLILFSLHKIPRLINHIGLYIGKNKFIHMLKTQGTSIMKLQDPFYSSKIRGLYRYER